ncbi:zinc ribbon domain-containing protein [Amycolatopsis sp. NPDC004079]|uniref:zinc ribbon domain-containing protein n=1 Tax=Amycolatopsis sp. NPDC004079 TaxID=3154549 RepID=UPI0033ADC116
MRSLFGYVVRFRRSDPGTVVWSGRQSDPEIVSVETFAQTRLLRRSRGAGGMRGIAKLERDRPAVKNVYLLEGLIRCEICGRKMQGAPIRKTVYYRCMARTLTPGSPALESHPKTVNLREDVVNGWLCQVFDPANRDDTVAAQVASQGGTRSTGRESAEKRLADAESRLRRHQAAIEASMDPAAVVEAINTAQAARAELQHLPKSTVIEAAEVYARPDSMDDVARALNSRTPERITRVYQDLGVQLRYDNEKEAVVVTASPRVSNVCVRGASCTLSTRLDCRVDHGSGC